MLGWVVREGVTNVLRHSDASRASIRVVADGDSRAVEVVDDGTTDIDTEGPGTRARRGSGLDGLRERAASLGGLVEAGPLPDRGFRLRVSVPLPAEAAG